MIFRLIENEFERKMVIQIEKEDKIVCRFDKHIDHILIKITYIPKNKLIELMSFKRWLKDRCKLLPTYFEKLANNLYDEIEEYVEPNYLRVEIIDQKDMRVSVSVK